MTEARDYRDTVFLPKTEFPMKAGLPQKEPGILARWNESGLYKQLREARAGREKFILHDGPPYANGDMHIGHALNHILKDMVVRTQSLLGKDAPYVPGWDCHGLPIEWKVEEQYRKKKLNKDEVPAEEFRAECRAYAQGWVDVQREQLKRLGINGDWDKPYLTMDFDAEATIVAELMKFAESGQLYRGAKPVMWSPVEKTALAEAEVEYEDVVSTQIDVAFEIVESPIAELVGAHAVIWTTTPWTIPVNQAIAYGPDVEYVLVQHGLHTHKRGAFDEDNPLQILKGQRSLVAEPLVMSFIARWGNAVLAAQDATSEYMWTPVAEWEVIGKGTDLAGTIARHPMAKLFPGEGRGPGCLFTAQPGGPLDPGLRRDDAIRKRPAEAGRTITSLAQAELGDEAGVARLVLLLEIVEQRATLVDHHQEAAARVIVLVVRLEMIRQRVDAVGQDRDLDFGRTGVIGSAGVIGNHFGFAFRGNRHRSYSTASSAYQRLNPRTTASCPAETSTSATGVSPSSAR